MLNYQRVQRVNMKHWSNLYRIPMDTTPLCSWWKPPRKMCWNSHIGSYIYIYIYIYIISIFTRTHIYIYMYVCINVNTHTGRFYNLLFYFWREKTSPLMSYPWIPRETIHDSPQLPPTPWGSLAVAIGPPRWGSDLWPRASPYGRRGDADDFWRAVWPNMSYLDLYYTYIHS